MKPPQAKASIGDSHPVATRPPWQTATSVERERPAAVLPFGLRAARPRFITSNSEEESYVRHDAKAVSAGLTGGSGIRGALVLAVTFVLALALSAPLAQASFVETGSWDVTSETPGVLFQPAYDISADPTSGALFTGASAAGVNSPTPPLGAVAKWLPDGTPGTPAEFGESFSSTSEYAGVAVDPINHRVYALVDPHNTGSSAFAASMEPKVTIYEPDGTLVTSFPVETSHAVNIDVDSAGNVYVPDPAAHAVNKYSSTGALEDTTSGSSLADPRDVAVDELGNLYVVDHSTNPVNEKQEVDFEGATEGGFRLHFNGAHSGVDFTGDVSAATGTGEVVQAAGPATRTTLAEGTGDLAQGNTIVTGVANAASFTVGESINAGENQQYIEFGTTITAKNPGAETITLSQSAAKTGAAVALTSGSKVLTGVSNVANFKVGMGLVGFGTEGIPFAYSLSSNGGSVSYVTTITAVNVANEELTLADGVLSSGTGEIHGEYIINASASSGSFAAHQKLFAAPLGFGVYPAWITAINGSTLVVADVFPPESDSPPTALNAASYTLTNLNVTSGQFAPFLHLVGSGASPGDEISTQANTKVPWDLSAHTLTISNFNPEELPFTEAGTGVTFHADLTRNALLATGGNHDTFDAVMSSLPTVGGAKIFNAVGSNPSEVHPFGGLTEGATDLAVFANSMGGRNLAPMTCEPAPGNPLGGGGGGCSVSTVQDGGVTPGRVAKFNAAGTFVENVVPPTGTYTADAVAVDKSTGDLYVAGGNGDWANPHGVLSGPDVPDFHVTRYDEAGNELGVVGVGQLAAESYLTGAESSPLEGGAAFGLSIDSSSGVLYTVGRPTDLTYKSTASVVRAFSPAHTLTVDPVGTGVGTVNGDSGAISACAKGGGGTCAGEYAVGTEVTLSATPGALSGFTSWSVDGQPGACPGNGDCTVTLSADTTVHATFTQTEENLTVAKEGGGTGTVTSNPAGIDCGSTCGPVAFSLGGSVTLQASADSGSVFSGWSGGGCSGTADCVVTLNAATTVHATFTQVQPLTVVKEGTGTGTVASNPAGIDCGSTCGPSTFPEGSSVTLQATPDAHQVFDHWTGGGCSGSGDCTVTMSGPLTVHAVFTQITHNVSVIKDGSGSGTVAGGPIGCGGTCSAPAPEGTPVILTATPATHSAFASWSGCDSSTANQCTVNVDGVENVTATFTLIKHTLTVAPVGTGTGEVSAEFGEIEECSKSGGTCTESPIEGTPVILIATPGPHSNLVWDGCDAVPSANECEITINSDAEVKATFTLRTHTLAVSKTGTGSGSVTCDGGACAASYPEGASVTLAAAAGAGSTFAGWSGASCSGAGGCTVTIDAETAVSAKFDLNAAAKQPTCETDPTLCQKPTVHKCKKGFKKKKVHGKVKCVKVKKRRHHKH